VDLPKSTAVRLRARPDLGELDQCAIDAFNESFVATGTTGFTHAPSPTFVILLLSSIGRPTERAIT
jgi:hypothetical protein